MTDRRKPDDNEADEVQPDPAEQAAANERFADGLLGFFAGVVIRVGRVLPIGRSRKPR